MLKNDQANFKNIAVWTFISNIKGGLSARMTGRFLNVRVIFSLKKKTIQFSLSFNHYF